MNEYELHNAGNNEVLTKHAHTKQTHTHDDYNIILTATD